MKVNGQSISLPSGSAAWAAIDTGTTGVGCPSDVLASIFAAVPNSAPGTGQFEGYYTFRKRSRHCSQLELISLFTPSMFHLCLSDGYMGLEQQRVDYLS